MKRSIGWMVLAIFVSLTANYGLGQSTVALGTPAFGSFAGGSDAVNLANLNVHWNFPIISKAGRGLPFVFNIPYDSTVWTPLASSGGQALTPPSPLISQYGWPTIATNAQGLPGNITNTSTVNTYQIPCYVQYPHPQYVNVTVTTYTNWAYVDASNTVHKFPGSYTANVSPSCPPANFGPPSGTWTSSDGYTISITGGSNATVTSKSGKNVTPQYGTICGGFNYYSSGFGSMTDSNGNYLQVGCGTFQDTLGKTALTITGGSAAPPVVFTAPNATYTLRFLPFHS